MPGDEMLALVAAVLRRPVEQLVELDRRSFRLAFVPGDFATVTVRDRRSREVLEVTIDRANGVAVDQAALRSQDQQAARAWPALTPGLRDLLLRHPDLNRIEVTVSRSGGAVEHWVGDAAGVVALAGDPDVVNVDLAADPEILDAGTGSRSPPRAGADADRDAGP